jgi:hypothetical protein
MRRTLPRLFLSALLACVHGLATPVDVLPAGFAGAAQPQVTIDELGGLHLAFGKGDSIYYVRSKDGARWSDPMLVGTAPKLALGLRRGPRINATGRAILITAISHADGNLHAWTTLDGDTWNEQAALNETPRSAREGLQALAGDGRGKVAVTWLDLRTGRMSLWAKFSSDGGLRWSEDRLVYASPDGPICQCCAPAVAFAADGRIGFLWRNLLQGARDLYLSETTDGRTFSPARKLGQGTWMLNACPMDGGALAYGPDSTAQAVWKRQQTVYAHNDLAREIRLAQPAAQAVTTYLGSLPLSAWESDGRLLLRHGEEAPRLLATGGRFASLASRGNVAAIAFEGDAAGRRTILCELIR